MQAFDAILLDLGLPDNMGLASVQAIRDGAPTTPVIVISGNEDPETGRGALALGAQDFVIKGRSEPAAIVRLIEYALERQQLVSELQAKNKESEIVSAQLRRLIADHGDAMIIVDPEGIAVFVNPAGEGFFGRSSADLVGMNIGIPIGSNAEPEINIVRPDVQNSTVDMRVTETLWDGKPAYLAALRDISARKEAEANLRVLASDANKASEMKSRFLVDMGHELRTPLNGMIGYMDAIKQESFGPIENDKYLEYIDIALQSGHELLNMINDLMDLPKLEAHKVELDEQPFQFDAVVRECLVIITSLTNKAGVHYYSKVGRAYVTGDAKRFRQVLLNLLSNAVRFTPAGGEIVVSAELNYAGDFVVSVRNTGVGIAKADLQNLFGDYIQVGDERGDARKGTGLGLPICKQFVELHGGSINIDSVLGEWTCVSFAIPFGRVLASLPR